MSSRPELRLDWCSHEAAKYAVEHWHYSRSIPAGKLAKIGVWEGSQFKGVIIYGRGAARNIGKPYGISQTEVCELCRVALARHEWPVTRILSIANRILSRSMPTLRLIVSYADANHGHYGGIYQGSNWVYVGQVPSRPKYVSPVGKLLHGRQVSRSGLRLEFGQLKRVAKIADCNLSSQLGKHKYLMPLDPDMRFRIAHLAQPYPKRAGSIDSDAASIQGE